MAIDPALQPYVHLMETVIPFNRFLNMKVERLERGLCVIRLPFADHLIGDPSRPALHGGVSATLLDTVGGAACFSRFESFDDTCSTVDLRVDYLRPGPSSDLWAVGRVLRMGRRMAWARMAVYGGALPEDGGPDEPFATAQGVYNLVRRG